MFVTIIKSKYLHVTSCFAEMLAKVSRLTAAAAARVSPGDVINHQRARGSPVVAPCDGSEPLLSCRVPDLQLDLLTADFDYPRPELHSDCVRAVSHNCDTTRNAGIKNTRY